MTPSNTFTFLRLSFVISIPTKLFSYRAAHFRHLAPKMCESESGSNGANIGTFINAILQLNLVICVPARVTLLPR